MPAFDRVRKPYDRPISVPSRNGTRTHDRAAGDDATHPGGPSARLVVSNLHWDVTQKDLESIFSTIGTLVREPVIRFDRSGRSTGVAFVSYSSNAEATKAKNQLDGKIAKAQAMSIAYDMSTPRIPPGVKAAAARGGSLLNRVSKPPLLSRLSGNEVQESLASSGPGPIRTRAAAAATRGGGGGTRTPRPREQKKEKTIEELDKELEAFMGDGSKENGDVTMS